MKVLELNKQQKEKEVKELERKYKLQEQRKEQWNKFKGTSYFKLVLEIIDEEIEKEDLKNALSTLSQSPKDLAEFGAVSAVQLRIYAKLQQIKQRIINER